MMINGLYELAKESIELIQSKMKEATPREMVVINHRINHFEVSENGRSITSSEETQVKKDWTFFVYSLFEKSISKIPAFQNVVVEITKYKFNAFNNIEPQAKYVQAEHWLGDLIRKIMFESIENNLTQSRLFELISMFENELHQGPSQQKLIGYICGVFPKEKAMIVLDDETILRQVVASDLEYTYQMGDTPHQLTTQRNLPTAVIETTMLVSRNKSFELDMKLERVLSVLRLYRLGSIHKVYTDYTDSNVIWPMSRSVFCSLFGPSYGHIIERNRYVIKEGEKESLQTFYNVIEPLVSKIETEKKSNGLAIALNRYENALLDQVDNERVLMTAIMGLEALFSLPSDKGEIGYKLGLRISKFLHAIGYDAKQVRNDVMSAYSFRNRVAHGLVIRNDESEKIANLTGTITNLLRTSLILFLLLGPSKKSETIMLIDFSMIDKNSNTELDKRISSIKERLPPEVF